MGDTHEELHVAKMEERGVLLCKRLIICTTLYGWQASEREATNTSDICCKNKKFEQNFRQSPRNEKKRHITQNTTKKLTEIQAASVGRRHYVLTTQHPFARHYDHPRRYY